MDERILLVVLLKGHRRPLTLHMSTLQTAKGIPSADSYANPPDIVQVERSGPDFVVISY